MDGWKGAERLRLKVSCDVFLFLCVSLMYIVRSTRVYALHCTAPHCTMSYVSMFWLSSGRSIGIGSER